MRIIILLLLALLSNEVSAADADVPTSQVWYWPGAVEAGDVSGTIRLPASNTSFGLGGFVRTYMMYSDLSLDRRTRGAQLLHVPQIPVTSGGVGGGSRYNMHAKESRLWFKSYTPSRWGEISTYIEYDLSESAEAYDIRLRHAYMTAGNLLVGQTYSTFTNTSALADIEAAIAVGNIVTRQPVIRWTQPIAGGTYEWMVAVEAAESKLAYSDKTAITTNEHGKNPDMVFRVNGQQTWGNVSLAAISRQITLDTPEANVDYQSRGNAVSVAGRISTGILHNIRFMLSYGDGLARYITASTYADGAIDSDGRRQLNKAQSGMVAYQHYWNSQLRSTLAYSYSKTDLPDWAAASLTQSARHANINLIWVPRSQILVGLEYLHAQRIVKDGRDGELNRMQVTLRFNF